MSHAEVLDLLEEISAVSGVRGALVTTPDGTFAQGRHSGLAPTQAEDVAGTVRRMTVASETVGARLGELHINFGGAGLLVAPMAGDCALVVILQRDAAASAVRSLLSVELRRLDQLVAQLRDDSAMLEPSDEDDELERLWNGELGGVLRQIEDCYRSFHVGRQDPAIVMREQLQEWLLCCNPSPYTFPLLIDGLSQSLNAAPERRTPFMHQVQAILRESGIWQGRVS